MAPSKSAVVLLAEGSEEIEFVTAVDVLRRAGVEVTVAGLNGSKCVKCSRGVSICADIGLSEALGKDYDAVIIPGGLGGVENLSKSDEVKSLLKKQESRENAIIAAICAGPLVLNTYGIALKKTITSYPSVKDKLTSNYNYKEDTVVVDGNLITSRGPGTAMDFSLCIVEKLVGKDVRNKIASGLLHSR